MENIQFESITIAVDMHGCPNRCRHCWLGWGPNANLGPDDLRFAADAFRPFTNQLLVYDWYREPDMSDDYKILWELCNELSTPGVFRDHFELASVPRLATDPEYPRWLANLGVKTVQLTFFGGEAMTDRMTGRSGAHQDLLTAIEKLLDHGITPRIQVFVHKNNLSELPILDGLIDELDLENRCRILGRKFSFFLHQGSCDGKNRDFYSQWLTPEDLNDIPPRLVKYTLRHWGAENLQDVFGRPEQELYEELLQDHTTKSMASEKPVLYIDSTYNIYPNFTTPGKHWCLGNLMAHGRSPVENVAVALENYRENRCMGQDVRATVPVAELARRSGDPSSQRLFDRGDYLDFLLGEYLTRL